MDGSEYRVYNYLNYKKYTANANDRRIIRRKCEKCTAKFGELLYLL